MKNKKVQAFTEFWATYGWAIFAAVIAIGLVAYFGVFTSKNSQQNSTANENQNLTIGNYSTIEYFDSPNVIVGCGGGINLKFIFYYNDTYEKNYTLQELCVKLK